MSGIFGIYYLNGQTVDPENIQQMVDKLAHRGPDGADIWCSESVGLGHRMLWTTPESLLEKLPMVSEDGNLVITSDCRIDNREELLSRLQMKNRPPEKVTDTDLILAAYQEWGEDCPQHLLGDFAFAIWDGREQKLFCARDHMGVKPFYYYASENVFVFGSEIKAILCLSEVPRKLNETKVGDYLASLLQDKVNTFYQGIFRLPPASYLSVSTKGLEIGCYWKLDPNYELRLNSDEEYADKLREIFTEAVRCRLRSAFPIGSHLSGGLDSSSVTCVARELLVKNGKPLLHTFSDIFEEVPECDERLYINTVVALNQLIPQYIHADKTGPLSELNHIFRYHDEVFFGPTYYQMWNSNHVIKQQGIRIILDGFDGDTTLSHGEGYLTELSRSGKWEIFAKEADDNCKLLGGSPVDTLRVYGLNYLEELAQKFNWLAFAKEVKQISKHFNISQRYLFVHHGLKPLFPLYWRLNLRLPGKNQEFRSQNDWFFNRHFVKKNGLKQRIQTYSNSLHKALTEREQHWQCLNSGLVSSMMEIIDQSSSALSIEARHPFMDKRLIEFCLSLPPQQKLNKGWSRLIMRRAMTNILPKEVQWRRTKTNMMPSFLYGLLKYDRKALDDFMHYHLENISDYVDTKSLLESYERLISAKNIGSTEQSISILLWKVIMLANWLNNFQLKQ